MKTVILAEKPNQARSYAESFQRAVRKEGYYQISDPLFEDAVITYAVGHLVELAIPAYYDEKWSKWSLEALPIFPKTYHFQVSADKKKQFGIVKRQLLAADTIIIATDSDREGESIAWSIIQQVGADKGNKTFKRLWINSLEKDAVYEGFKNLRPGADNFPKFIEARTRQIADWLIGMNGSPLYSLLLQKKGLSGSFSLGRVQTPTLYMIYQLQEKIANFKKEPYFEGGATVVAKNGTFQAKLHPNKTFRTAEELSTYIEVKGASLKSQLGMITDVQKAEKSIASPRLFSLSSLQTRMNQLVKASARDTLAAVQSLYEAKLLSYPRTDSNYITDNEFRYLRDHLDDYKHFLKMEHVPTPNLTANKRYVDSKKVEEHYAIIPTKKVASEKKLAKLTSLQLAVYDQVLKVTVAMFAGNYRYEETTILTDVQKLQLKAVGKVTKDLGWKAILFSRKDAEAKDQLPSVEKQENVQVTLAALEKEKQPPKPFTEGTLLTAMKTAGKTLDDEQAQAILKEVEGIGTEATRASIIETLKQKDYIKVEKNYLVVTEKGKIFCKAVENERLLTSAEMTASWETYLKKIGNRQGDPEHFLASIKKFISHLIEEVPSEVEKTNFGADLETFQQQTTKKAANSLLGTCPKCGHQVKLYKKVASCTNESCDFKIWIVIAKKKLTQTQLKELLAKGRTSRLVKGLTGKKGKFDAFVVLKDDFTTAFEFPKKKTTAESSK